MASRRGVNEKRRVRWGKGRGTGKRKPSHPPGVAGGPSFRTAGKERNRSGALAGKNDAIALKKPELKREAGATYSARGETGKRAGGGSSGAGYSGRETYVASVISSFRRIQGRIPLDSWEKEEEEEEKARRQRVDGVIATERETERVREREREREREKGRRSRQGKKRKGEKVRGDGEEQSAKLPAVPLRHFVTLSKASLQTVAATTTIYSRILVGVSAAAGCGTRASACNPPCLVSAVTIYPSASSHSPCSRASECAPIPPPAPAPARKRYGRVASFLNARQLEPPPNGSKTITVSHSLPPAPLFLEETRFHRSLVARDYVIRRNNNIVSLGNDCC